MMSTIVQAICLWKSIAWRVVFAGLSLCLMLVGCQNPTAPSVQKLLADLAQLDLPFTPGEPVIGANPPLFPPDQYPIWVIAYQRPQRNVIFMHIAPSIAHAQQLERRLQTYATEYYGLGGIDLPGPVRYYRCTEVIVVYGALVGPGIDPAID